MNNEKLSSFNFVTYQNVVCLFSFTAISWTEVIFFFLLLSKQLLIISFFFFFNYFLISIHLIDNTTYYAHVSYFPLAEERKLSPFSVRSLRWKRRNLFIFAGCHIAWMHHVSLCAWLHILKAPLNVIMVTIFYLLTS